MANEPDGQWELNGADNEPILGDVHMPTSDPRGVCVLVHGFLGYKNYGMIPYLARQLAQAGFITHKYNASHSGVTRDFERFERPEVFGRDTWNKQVFDLRRVLQAIADGTIAGADKPRVVVGHSRGGVATLLMAGRDALEGRPAPEGIVTIASPADTCRRSEEERALIRDGRMEVVSNRTGQTLRVSPAWLTEQEDDPEAHDVLALARGITCPILIVQGTADTTVEVRESERLEEALQGKCQVERILVPGADHVFCTPNPMPLEQLTGKAPVSPELRALTDEMVRFCKRVCGS